MASPLTLQQLSCNSPPWPDPAPAFTGLLLLRVHVTGAAHPSLQCPWVFLLLLGQVHFLHLPNPWSCCRSPAIPAHMPLPCPGDSLSFCSSPAVIRCHLGAGVPAGQGEIPGTALSQGTLGHRPGTPHLGHVSRQLQSALSTSPALFLSLCPWGRVRGCVHAAPRDTSAHPPAV